MRAHNKKAPGYGRFLVGLLKENLLDIGTALLAIALACQSFLGPSLFARLQVKGVSFDLLNDVFLLYLALKTPERAFERFAVL